MIMMAPARSPRRRRDRSQAGSTCRLKSWLELAEASIMSPATVPLECSSECSCGRNDRRGFRPGRETQALPGPALPRAQIVVPQWLGRAFEPGFFWAASGLAGRDVRIRQHPDPTPQVFLAAGNEVLLDRARRAIWATLKCRNPRLILSARDDSSTHLDGNRRSPAVPVPLSPRRRMAAQEIIPSNQRPNHKTHVYRIGKLNVQRERP